eukprot:1026565-Rhodomonas_salina.2
MGHRATAYEHGGTRRPGVGVSGSSTGSRWAQRRSRCCSTRCLECGWPWCSNHASRASWQRTPGLPLKEFRPIKRSCKAQLRYKLYAYSSVTSAATSTTPSTRTPGVVLVALLAGSGHTEAG